MSENSIPVKYAMISQPMAGVAEEDIGWTRDKALQQLKARGYYVLDTYYEPEDIIGPVGGNIPLRFLAMSLAAMSRCETVYFCNGWDKARGCRIEHKIAEEYGLKILYESDEEKNLTYADNDPGEGGLSYV